MIDIKFELDIPSLTEHGIQMDDLPFWYVKELNSSSMIDLSIIIKMLILLIDSYDRIETAARLSSELSLFVHDNP